MHEQRYVRSSGPTCRWVKLWRTCRVVATAVFLGLWQFGLPYWLMIIMAALLAFHALIELILIFHKICKCCGKSKQFYNCTLCSEKKHPLMFRCITLRKSSQFERTFQTSVKVSLGPTAMRFTIDDKHLIKWMWVEKKLRRKTLSQDVIDRRWRLDGVKTLIKLSVQDLQLCRSLQWGGHCVVDYYPNVCDPTAVTFSVKCYNPLKLYLLSRKHLQKLQKVACFILFIYSRAFNNNVIFSLIAVTILLLTSGLHGC